MITYEGINHAEAFWNASQDTTWTEDERTSFATFAQRLSDPDDHVERYGHMSGGTRFFTKTSCFLLCAATRGYNIGKLS